MSETTHMDTPMDTKQPAPQSPTRLERLERITELPLMLLSFMLIPVLTGLYLWDLTPVERRIYTYLEIVIWALFSVIFFAKVALAPNKIAYVRRNWLEAALVIVPVLRPFRIVRAVFWIARDISHMNRLVTIESLTGYGIGMVLLAATIVTSAEQNAEGANIQNFTDGIYWSLVTMSTVGYGDHYPVTPIGKFTAVFLMFFGIGIFGAAAGKIFTMVTQQE